MLAGTVYKSGCQRDGIGDLLGVGVHFGGWLDSIKY
jgi:hypothetical protein